MGVPSFFRYLTKKYPGIVEYFFQKESLEATVPGLADAPLASPDTPFGLHSSSTSIDHLYLDMNGIIHNSSHGGAADGRTEAEVKAAMFIKLDEIVELVKPKKLIMLALDGVAPRAKMNQQRSRRFNSIREKKAAIAKTQEDIDRLLAAGASEADLASYRKKQSATDFDSNAISPGTELMEKVSAGLQEYIALRLQSHPLWKNLNIILSDSSVPGEGEHKIMEFIRRQRQLPTHNPDIHHCFYGGDADLLFLGLSVHERKFTILREDNSAWRYKPLLEKKSDTVFVGRLPMSLTEAQLARVFAAFGPVKRTVILTDGLGASKGIGLVQYQAPEDAERAVYSIVRINRTKRLIVKFERPEELDRHLMRNEALKGVKDTLGVRNLPYQATEAQLGQLFLSLFQVRPREVRIITNPTTGQSKGFGFVSFDSEETALAVYAKAQPDLDKLRLDNRVLKIEVSARKRPVDPNDHRDEHIRAFLKEVDRFENALAYSYLQVHAFDVEKSVTEFKAGVAPGTMFPKVEAPIAAASAATPTPVDSPSLPHGGDVGEDKAQEEADQEAGEGPQRPLDETLVFVHMHALRQYLHFEFSHALTQLTNNPKAEFDLHRCIDDYVLICMLCGNDFLPHIPSLDIRRGAIDLLLELYKVKCLQHGIYLVHNGQIQFDKLKLFIDELSKTESNFMVRKMIFDSVRKQKFGDTAARAAPAPSSSTNKEPPTDEEKTISALMLDPYAPIVPTVDLAGWHQSYYQTNFKLPNLDRTFLNTVAQRYLEGLIWVHRYYYFGVDSSSWQWFYPYHFAPLAVDLPSVMDALAAKAPTFEMGTPFKPIEQLLAVLPPESAPCLPPAYAKLLTSLDSPIKDFYPTEFETVVEPGKPEWSALALLEFIDAKRLLAAAAPLESTLTKAEILRNTLGPNLLYTQANAPLHLHGSISSLPADRTPKDVPSGLQVQAFADPTVENFKIGPIVAVPLQVGLSSDELQKCLPRRTKWFHDTPPHSSPKVAAAEAIPSEVDKSGPDDLADTIDFKLSECLNSAAGTELKNCFLNDPAKILASDVDEQLLISLSFKVPVKPHSIQFVGIETEPSSGPKTIKIFVNPGNLTFDDVSSAPAVLSMTEYKSGQTLPLPAAKFLNVSKLTVFIESNYGAAVSKLVRILVKGKPMPGASQPVKQAK